MRQLVLVAVLAALAASAITFAACEVLRPQAPAASPGLTAAEMRVVLAEVLREAGRARREAASLRPEVPEADAPRPVAATPRTPAAIDESSGAAPGAPVVRRGLPPGLSETAPSLDRFRQALPRAADGSKDYPARRAELRRWMFRGEREVFEWFGQPDEVNPEGETENWIYFVPTGERDADGQPLRSHFYIRLSKGRLVGFDD